jgi:hypothetical protein
MDTTYAVSWREPDGATYLGRLELGTNAIVLEGQNGGGEPVTRSIAYDELHGLHLADAHDGQPSLVVERDGGELVLTSTVMHAGVLQELIRRLSALGLEAPRRATVVVPLKEGALERVRELAAQGPPFDPADAQLTRHQLLLTPFEAVFIFEADSDLALDSLLREVDIWAAAAVWRDLVAGPPRLAELAYTWERPPRIAKIGLGL